MSGTDTNNRSLTATGFLNPEFLPIVRPETTTEQIQDWLGSISHRYASLLVFFITGCLFSVAPIVNAVLYEKDNKDYSHWYMIGQSVLAGQPLYEDVRHGEPEYMYPPTAAVLFYAPLSTLGHTAFVGILCFLTAISWGLTVWAATVLVRGKWDSNLRMDTILPGLAVAPYVWDIQLLGQTNLLLLAFCLGAFLLIRQKHPVSSGLLFGMAVALKAFPLPAIAYFIVRRKWVSVAASMFSIVLFVWFLPGVYRGFERNTRELNQWASLMIFDQSGETMAGRSSIGFTRRNQSLVSISHRLLRHVDAGDNPQKPLFVNIANITPRNAQLVGYGSCLLLGLVLLLACRFSFAPSAKCEGLEVAMVCTLVPLCSPLAWTYFFCWLLPAWTAITFWWSNPSLDHKTQRIVKFAGIVSGILLASAITEQFDPTLQAYGMTAWGSVMLFLTLAFIRFHLSNESPEGVVA